MIKPIPNFTLHDLARQSFARLCAVLPSGIPPRVAEAWIDARFGHADFERMSPSQCRQVIELCQKRTVQLKTERDRYDLT